MRLVGLFVPVEANVPKVIVLFATSVVTVVVPDTVKAALSVIAAPLVKARFPFTVPCTPKAVVPLSMVTWPVVPCEETVTLPVNAFVVVLRVIAASFAEAVKLEVEPTFKAPV